MHKNASNVLIPRMIIAAVMLIAYNTRNTADLIIIIIIIIIILSSSSSSSSLSSAAAATAVVGRMRIAVAAAVVVMVVVVMIIVMVVVVVVVVVVVWWWWWRCRSHLAVRELTLTRTVESCLQMKAAGFSEMLVFTRLHTTIWVVYCVHRLDNGQDDLGFESRQGQVFFFKMSPPALEPTQPPV